MTVPVAGKSRCKQCGELADPVHHYPEREATPVFRGWFCPYCGHFEKPIMRERGLDVEVKT